MTARQQRRHEEHKARKEAYKAERKAQSAVTAAMQPAPLSESLDFTPEPIGFEPQPPAPPTRAQINRENAQHSTGPRTPEGKAISAMNRFRHGLAGNFALLDWEKEENYYHMLRSLHEEHQPETMTEYLLVERMAQHQWLSQRAVYLQDVCFRLDVPLCEQQKELALYLRYQTTHDRAFHKCLADLLKLRAQKLKEQHGFESQKHRQAAETRKQELHEAKLQAVQTKKNSVHPPVSFPSVPATISTPVPDGFVPQTCKNRPFEPRVQAA